MKILFITQPHEDYLSDSLLIGIRQLLGNNCIDYPKAEVLYQNHGLSESYRLYGKGFTLYSGILGDDPIDRFRILSRIAEGEFDLIIFGSIWEQYGLFVQMRPWLTTRNTIILDGADAPAPYPAAGLWWRRPYYWFLPRAHREFLYFKREWTGETRFTPFPRFIPRSLRDRLPCSSMLRKISFSIPETKIVSQIPLKTKDFPKHIVDAEVAKHIPGAATSYAFSTEAEYYADLQASRYGVTTRRSGWDCLRHYEIAANGAVPCFRDLASKPQTCAPHGLNEFNCIVYRSADELFERIKSIGEDRYAALQQGALQWVHSHTTTAVAKYLLEEHQRFVNAR